MWGGRWASSESRDSQSSKLPQSSCRRSRRPRGVTGQESRRSLASLCALSHNHFDEKPYADFEFVLAAIPVQLQALPNLLPSAQATPIREYVLQAMSTPDLGSYPRETIRQYQVTWDEALERGEPPYFGVASVLLDKLECANSGEVGGVPGNLMTYVCRRAIGWKH